MSGHITLVNNLSGDKAFPAEFHILQGKDPVARLVVPVRGRARLSTGDSYTVTASTNVGNSRLQSNPVMFDKDSAHLLARMRMTEPGVFDFELVQLGSGSKGQAITCENTCREPVTFTIQRNGSPMSIVKVVDEHNSTTVSTVEQWECFAIVNGITTLPVRMEDPNAVITVNADNGGFLLTVG